jgi:hypothetical protein
MRLTLNYKDDAMNSRDDKGKEIKKAVRVKDGSETIVIEIVDYDGTVKCVPNDPANSDYQRFITAENEGRLIPKERQKNKDSDISKPDKPDIKPEVAVDEPILDSGIAINE